VTRATKHDHVTKAETYEQSKLDMMGHSSFHHMIIDQYGLNR